MRNNAEMPLLDNIGLAQNNDLTIFETLQNAEVCRIEKKLKARKLIEPKRQVACCHAPSTFACLLCQTRRHATQTGFMRFVDSGRFNFFEPLCLVFPF
jgi:hypothetical protein